MSKIVIDARQLTTSTGRYIERLIHYLQDVDHTNDYTILLKPEYTAGWQPRAGNFCALACPHREFTFDEQLGFKRQLDDVHADLVHFGMTQQPVRYKGKVVTTIHDLTTLRFSNPDKNVLLFKVKQQVYKDVVKRAARKSAALLVPSYYVKDDVAQYTGVASEKITVTHEAADSIADAPEPVEGLEGTQFLMYVGRPTPHKNLEHLITAYQSLKQTHSDLTLVLAGRLDANYKRVEAKLKAQRARDVVFTGFVSEGQLRWLYENCAAYVFPSFSEGFGLPGLEAMVHGAPVLSSNATCLPEVYGDAAQYFDPNNVKSMADAIEASLTSHALRKTLVEKGREQAAKYSWRRTAEQTLAVYKTVLEG